MNDFSLHRAAKDGDLDMARQLIEMGASVDSRDDEECTPLHVASTNGSYEVAELLISSKCDLNQKNRRCRTPVLCAASGRQRRVVELLLQNGARVNCADDEGLTLLHHAIKKGWTDLIRHVLERGEADPNAAMKRGRTPLAWAAYWGRDEVVSLLIQAGADVNRRDGEKRTALHMAADRGCSRVVQVLLEVKELELNLQDEDGDTPLHDAFQGRSRDVRKQLLEAGADTNIKNNKGETALSVGIRRNFCIIRNCPECRYYQGKLTLEDVRLFVLHGAYLEDCDFVRISKDPFLKENVQKDVGLCTQSIVNKFHHQSLPALNSISYFARKLPCIAKFELNSRQVDEVEDLVKCEIERNTFCNLVKAHPMALSALCVLSLITCQSGTKRSASLEFGHSPLKKLHT